MRRGNPFTSSPQMLIDLTRLAGRALDRRMPTGVDRVSVAYLQHFETRARALVRFGGRWIEFSQSHSRRLFEVLLRGHPRQPLMIRTLVAQAYATCWRHHRAQFLFNTGHNGLERPDYVGRVRAFDLRPLFFLHDLIPISHPEYCRPGEADRHHARLDTMLSVGCGLIVNSEATRQALLEYAARKQRAIPPCVLAPLAPADLPRKVGRRPLAHPYFVVLGTLEPRKNHLLLLHVWRQLIADMGELAPRLVVIGHRGWECEQVVDLLDRCAGLRDFVIEMPRVDDAALADWLGHAQALLFPSFTEGYGMPLTEALLLRLPVIASDLRVFREIADDIPEYLDPLDGVGWRRMILAYMRPDSPRGDRQRARMRSYRPTTWAQHFAVVESLLERLAP